MRQYKKEHIIYNNRYGGYNKTTSLNKGLKEIHIGNDVWLFGKQKNEHMVVYATDRKTEHHVYGDIVKKLCQIEDIEWGGMRYINVNRHGNQADEANVKIYILTSILDDVDNWCFDLTKIPANGKLKIICHNGTIKNIDFTGTFDKILKQKYVKLNNNLPSLENPYYYSYQYMHPVGYRVI